MTGADMNEGGGRLSRTDKVIGLVSWAAVLLIALAVGATGSRADAPFEQSSREWRDQETRVEFTHLAPGLCTVKTWRGSLQVTPDVEWVYEGLCSAGGTLVRYDYCVRMARGE